MKTYLALIGAFLMAQVSSAGVNYPVIEPELRQMIETAQKKGPVVSEWAPVGEGGHVVISFPKHPWKGMVFEVFFEDLPWLTPWLPLGSGYKQPVLKVVGVNYAFIPVGDEEYRTYEDGSKSYYGSSAGFGSPVYMYATSTPPTSTREKNGSVTVKQGKWFVTVTWGAGADVNDPGNTIDRTHLGTVPGENPRLGFDIQSISMLNGKPNLRVKYDSRAEFVLETSLDLENWQPMSYYLDVVPRKESWEGYVKIEEGVVTPMTPFGGFKPTQNFRLRKKVYLFGED